MLSFALPLLACAQPQVNIGVTRDGSFEVFHSRAKSTATGAALAGLIGAAVQTGIESSSDSKKTTAVLAKIKDSSCRSRILTSLEDKLVAKDYLVELTEDMLYPNLNLSIDYCGFKIVNTQTNAMAAFARLTATYLDINKKQIFKEVILITGRQEIPYSELESGDVDVETELSQVLQNTGKRIANKIIYHR